MLLALDQNDSPMLLWLIVGGLLALGPALRSWIGVIEFFKGRAFDPANFVTQQQLQLVKAERDAQITATITQIREEFNGLKTTLGDIARELPAIHRALGRLEGHDERENRPR